MEWREGTVLPGLGQTPVCIDEYQQVPAILDAIKAELNRDTSPGRFILTGSTRHDAPPRAAQALTGRLHLVTLYPFSQGEIPGSRENLVEVLFEEASRLVTPEPSSTSREELPTWRGLGLDTLGGGW